MKLAKNAALLLSAALLPALAAACSNRGETRDTLPPFITFPPTTTIDVSTSLPLITVYIAQEGDSLLAIANAFNVDLEQMMEINGITDKNHVEVGQAIKIPPQRIVITELPTTTSTLPQP
jgi:hypothetical protein